MCVCTCVFKITQRVYFVFIIKLSAIGFHHMYVVVTFPGIDDLSLPRLKTTLGFGSDADSFSFTDSHHGSILPVIGENTDHSNVSNMTTGSHKKTVKYLKANRSQMFPKMKKLLERYDPLSDNMVEMSDVGSVKSSYESIEIDPRCISVEKLKCAKEDKKVKNIRQRPKSSIDGSNGQIKLLKQLTAYLPEQCFSRANDQMQAISNTDSIKKHKKRLLSASKHRLEGSAVDDIRWDHLETSLSETKGLVNNWHKIGQRWSLY